MNRGFSTDTYRVSYHGYAHSHIDALCHILYKDQTYNGYARADVNTEKGCTKLGIQNFRNGYVTRGILIDIPRLKGLPYLEPGTPIFVEDLEAWEKRAGMKVAPGDALLHAHRTLGASRRRSARGTSARTPPGCTRRSAAWLKARGVALIGSDAALDVVPSLVEGHQPAGPHAGDHRARPQHPRQPGSRSAGRSGGGAESLGVHADRRTGAGHRRHRLSGERAGDVLNRPDEGAHLLSLQAVGRGGEAHDCWTTTEEALTRDLPEDLREAWERLRETLGDLGEQRIYASHNSIMFSRKACYCLRAPLGQRLELCFFLGRAVRSPIVKKAAGLVAREGRAPGAPAASRPGGTAADRLAARGLRGVGSAERASRGAAGQGEDTPGARGEGEAQGRVEGRLEIEGHGQEECAGEGEGEDASRAARARQDPAPQGTVSTTLALAIVRRPARRK